MADGDPSDPPSEALCADWARRGECSSNPAYMLASCSSACEAVVQAPPETGGVAVLLSPLLSLLAAATAVVLLGVAWVWMNRHQRRQDAAAARSSEVGLAIAPETGQLARAHAAAEEAKAISASRAAWMNARFGAERAFRIGNLAGLLPHGQRRPPILIGSALLEVIVVECASADHRFCAVGTARR